MTKYTKGRDVFIGTSVKIGDDTVIGNFCYIAADVGENVTISNGVEIVRPIGDNSTIADDCCIHQFEVPANSVVECTNKFGNRYRTHIMWTPGGIFIKPGCKPLEPIAKTRTRLERIRDVSRIIWPGLETYEAQEEAVKMLAWLDLMETYEVVLL